jgi:hypothetical protein
MWRCFDLPSLLRTKKARFRGNRNGLLRRDKGPLWWCLNSVCCFLQGVRPDCIYISHGFLKKEIATGTRIVYLAIMPTRRNANIQTNAIIPVAIIIFSIILLVMSETFVESEFVCIFLYSPFKNCRFRFCITNSLENQTAPFYFCEKWDVPYKLIAKGMPILV